MGEMGHESEPREPFGYERCPFCGHATFAYYRDIYRFRCESCRLEGSIDRDSDGNYPNPPVEVRVAPSEKGFG